MEWEKPDDFTKSLVLRIPLNIHEILNAEESFFREKDPKT